MKKFILLLASFFGLGYSPVAPGTVGTLGGVLIYGVEQKFHLGWAVCLLIVIFIFAVGVFISTKAEKFLGQKDPSSIVIDEVAGFLVTMFMIPFSWKSLIIGFVLNRILDVWKPFPARQVQDLKGGWGIMVDDLISSFYAYLLLRGILWLAF